MLKNSSSGILGERPAFLFPGQGSQGVGMGKDLYENSPAARKVFNDVDDALGEPLTELMFMGPKEELSRTWNCQPAIMTVSLASLAAAAETDSKAVVHPFLMAGHSLGEYSALVAAGVMDLGKAATLVRERGRLMEEACQKLPGSMAAILGMEQEAVEEVCKEVGTQIANINSPGQIVISGEQNSITRAIELAKEKGARRAVLLQVSGAFHSYLMGPALDGMMKALNAVDFHHPEIPVIANCTAKPLRANREVKEELAEQLCGCVRWEDCIRYMADEGATSFIEFGPGNVLTGLAKKISEGTPAMAVNDMTSVRNLVGHTTTN